MSKRVKRKSFEKLYKEGIGSSYKEKHKRYKRSSFHYLDFSILRTITHSNLSYTVLEHCQKQESVDIFHWVTTRLVVVDLLVTTALLLQSNLEWN